MARKQNSRKSGDPSFQDLVDRDLRLKDYRPIYFLVGEDTYRIEGVVSHIRDDLLGSEGVAFNFHVFQGDQAELGDVLAQALSFPMLGSRQVIWLRHAENCLADRSMDASLEKYLLDPVNETCLIFSTDKLDGRRKWVRTAREKGFVFDFSPPKGAGLSAWVRKAARKAGLELPEPLPEALIELVGEDLHALAAEIQKLSLLAEDGQLPQTQEALAEVVMAQGTRGEFELVDNLQPANPGPALKVWRHQVTWGSRAEEVAPMLLWRMRKIALVAALEKQGVHEKEIGPMAGLHPWVCRRLRDAARKLGPDGIASALESVHRCDASLKSHSIRSDVVLERAIIGICSSDK